MRLLMLVSLLMLAGCATPIGTIKNTPNFKLEVTSDTLKAEYDNFTGEHDYADKVAVDGTRERHYKISKTSVVDWSDLFFSALGVLAGLFI